MLHSIARFLDRYVSPVCYAAAGLCVVLFIAAITAARPTTPPVSPQLLASVRAEVDRATQSVDGLSTQVEASHTLLVEIRDSLAELRNQSGRKPRSTATDAVADTPTVLDTLTSDPPAPLCLRVPGGADTDLTRLTAAATGRFTVSGMTYAQALVLNGFSLQDVALLDESTCQQVYDGWKSQQPQPPAASRQPSAISYQPTNYSCPNGQCSLRPTPRTSRRR